MTKGSLIEKVTEIYPYMSSENVQKVVDIIFDTITQALREGRRVELRGFGAFYLKDRKAIVARNPKTGEKVPMPARKVPFFKAGKQIKNLLNESAIIGE